MKLFLIATLIVATTLVLGIATSPNIRVDQMSIRAAGLFAKNRVNQMAIRAAVDAANVRTDQMSIRAAIGAASGGSVIIGNPVTNGNPGILGH